MYTSNGVCLGGILLSCVFVAAECLKWKGVTIKALLFYDEPLMIITLLVVEANVAPFCIRVFSFLIFFNHVFWYYCAYSQILASQRCSSRNCSYFACMSNISFGIYLSVCLMLLFTSSRMCGRIQLRATCLSISRWDPLGFRV